jgi:DinB superfamily
MTNATVLSRGLTPLEIDETRGLLERARQNVFSAAGGLSEAQANYAPALGGWSIAGILEHIAIVDALILARLADASADGEQEVIDAQTIDEIVKTQFPDRTRKFSAPEIVHPKGQWKAEESLERISGSTARLIERLKMGAALREQRLPAPPLKAITEGRYQVMDGYQWILAAATHTGRHVAQILEVKAESGFPR